ncbi:hypothetical protein [Kitasatospora griseola]|uniref:hypothetical protein n=1 Tax=Kitasatospora griseola TaxID=2064 RepID=UPI0037F865D2
MGILGWLLAVLAVLAAGTLGYWLRYPGAWRYAFGARYADRRRDLDIHRRRLCAVRRTARRAVAAARGTADRATAAHRTRIAAAQSEVDRLRDPGRGTEGQALGALRLCEHKLVLTTDGRATDHPLDSVALRAEHAADATHVHLVLPDGRQRELRFPHGEFTKAEVKSFVVAAHDGVARAKSARLDREALLPAAEAALAQVREDTAEVDRAHVRLEEVRAEQDADPTIAEAEQRWEDARDRWQRLTGVRPFRPYSAR